jgi:hypothetical protein
MIVQVQTTTQVTQRADCNKHNKSHPITSIMIRHSQPFVALVMALLTPAVFGHVRHICMSTTPDNPNECGTVTLWLSE